MRSNFIAAWVAQQQRAFNQSTRGIMTPEKRQILEDEAEAGMAAIERAAAEKAYEQGRLDERHDCNRYAEYQQGRLTEEQYARDVRSRNPYKKAEE